MLDGIEDPYNLGYAIRSVYASGASGVVLPKINRMNAGGIVCRSSAGASERIPLYICESSDEISEMKKQYGFSVICSDTENSVLCSGQISSSFSSGYRRRERGISRNNRSSDETVRIDYGKIQRGVSAHRRRQSSASRRQGEAELSNIKAYNN